MRMMSVIALATVVAGFTMQDAEKAISGSWKGFGVARHVTFDVQKRIATWTDGGKQEALTFEITDTSPGLLKMSSGSRRVIIHLQPGGITIAEEGDPKGQYFTRAK